MRPKNFAAVFCAAVVLTLPMVGCSNGDDSSSAAETSAAVTESALCASEGSVKGFSVEGTKLLDANGNEFVMRGINHAHSWYASQDIFALDAIADTGANCVRLVLGDGEQYGKDSADTIKSLIERCEEKDLIAIVEVHDATGKDEMTSIQNAADYWVEVKDALIGTEDTVILNIANEWVGTWDSEIWREGYTQVIPQIREAGIKNTIMVDAAGWGQYGKSIADYGKEVFESDPDKNTMFSIHMYGSAGGSEKTIEENITGVTDQDLCVCIGEFGYKHSDGDVDEEYIMKYCTENNIGYLAWSWKGNGGGVEYLDLAVEWDGSVLSSDWGEVAVNGENGIRATSKICSVFDE